MTGAFKSVTLATRCSRSSAARMPTACGRLLISLAFAVLGSVLHCTPAAAGRRGRALTSQAVANCTSTPPCGSDQPYYYCSAGNAKNGCRPMSQSQFPSADCGSQCLYYPAPAPSTGNCNSAQLSSPCNGCAWSAYCCLAGAVGGCSASPWTSGCTSQCYKTQAAPAPVPSPIPSPVPSPVPSPIPSPVPSPLPNPVSPSPIPSPVPSPTPSPVPSPTPSPVPSPIPSPVPSPTPSPVPSPYPSPPATTTSISTCTSTPPCPQDGSQYYYCSAGNSANGCRLAANGAYPSLDCSAQCTWTYASSSSSSAPPPTLPVTACPSTDTYCGANLYHCTAGAIGCATSPWDPTTTTCTAQCLMGSGTTSNSPTNPTNPPTSPPTNPPTNPPPTTSQPAGTRVFTVTNTCQNTVWLAATSTTTSLVTLGSGPDPSTWALPPQGTMTLYVPSNTAATPSTSGRLWARTGCSSSVSIPVCDMSQLNLAQFGFTVANPPCNAAQGNVAYCMAGTAGPVFPPASPASPGGCSLPNQLFDPAGCSQQCIFPQVPQAGPITVAGFSCEIGDCGEQVCQQGTSGANGPTLFEWTFDGADTYDVSNVDGHNVGITATPQPPNGGQCSSVGCNMNTSKCPPELQVVVPGLAGEPSTIACLGICKAIYSDSQKAAHPILQTLFDETTVDAYGTVKPMRDLLCCQCGATCALLGSACACGNAACTFGCSPYPASYAGNQVYMQAFCNVASWPLASDGTAYNYAFSSQCPHSYSWPYDDLNSLVQCSAGSTNYDITIAC